MRTVWPGAVAVALVAAAACDAPFTVPSTRALETGIAAGLSSQSFEINGTYTEAAQSWTIDLQLARPAGEHMTVKSKTVSLEAIVVGDAAYFRGSAFLAAHLGTDPASLNLLKAAGHSWWKVSGSIAPNLSDFTDPARFTATFLGSNITQRADHVTVDGVEMVDLSGPRADVWVYETPPYQVERMRLKPGVAIDGVTNANFQYNNYGHLFNIAPPADVIDFSDLSTLPPEYTVVDVDTSACGSPCVVSARLKNLGGSKGATAPSTVTFTMSEASGGAVLGSCIATVQPDVGYNATTTVSCTITGLSGQSYNAANVTATPTNPGRD